MSRLYPRLTLDIGIADLAYAALACARGLNHATEAEAVESVWAPGGDGLATLSVRSAFDLYLSALDLPAGSEVLLSGVTIPDMVRIVREHGLVPVPVDIALDTLFPTPRDCERACSPKSRLLVIAHLFGGRNDITPIAEWAHAHGLLIVEDCAQGFISPAERGSPRADATFYSFGSIKTMTALGGALVRVGDARVLARMRALQGEWPQQSTRRYASKVVRAALLMLVQQPRIYFLIALCCELTGKSFDRLIQESVKGFPVPPGGTLLPLLRHRPCGALLALLRRRLRTFSGTRLSQRAAQGDRTRDVLEPVAPVFGATQPGRTHWLFAILSANRNEAVMRGCRLGLDVAAGASSIAAVPRPAERPDLPPLQCEQFMQRILFIPVQPEIPPAALARVAEIAAPAERLIPPALSSDARARAARRVPGRAFLSLLLTLLTAPVLVAQAQPAPSIGSPILGEFVVSPSLMGDQRWAGGTLGIFLGVSWAGFAHERGYRLGLAAATAYPDEGPPTNSEVAEVHARFASALTIERIRIRVRGRRVVTTGYGAGVGSYGYQVLQTTTDGSLRTTDLDSWAPALTASVDVAYRLPPVASADVARPIDFFVGLRSVAIFGPRTIRGSPPSSGPIPTSRGIGYLHQLALGIRMGVFTRFFVASPEP